MNDEYRLAASPAPAPQPELPAPPRLARPEPRDHDTGFFAPEKKGVSKGVLGGLAMMTIAVVWFVAGYAAGYIFFYPPILFVIGLYALLKGILTGNLAGKD